MIALDNSAIDQHMNTGTRIVEIKPQRMINANLSFQKLLSSSIVLIAPLIRAKRTSTPPSFGPQKELQKSVERPKLAGEPALMYLESEVVDGCLFAVILDLNWQFKYENGGETVEV